MTAAVVGVKPDEYAPSDAGNAAAASIQLAALPRGDAADLRAEWSEYKGHRFFSLRQWNRSADGSWRPDGKRGLTVKKRELAAVAEALNRAIALAADDG